MVKSQTQKMKLLKFVFAFGRKTALKYCKPLKLAVEFIEEM